MKFSAVVLTPFMAALAAAQMDKISSLVGDVSSAVGGASGIASISDKVTSLIGSATATGSASGSATGSATGSANATPDSTDTDTALSTGVVETGSTGNYAAAAPTGAVAIGALMGGAAILVNM